jgi:hypothetical protein
MFRGYLGSIKTSEDSNESKTKGIKTGQKFLVGVLMTIKPVGTQLVGSDCGYVWH